MAKKEKVNKQEEVSTGGTDKSIELAGLVKNAINSGFKGMTAAHFFGSDDDIASDINLWLSSGSTMLDLAISNRPNGGYPFGRIIELYGGSSSGKSLLAVTTLREVQRMGGIAVYIDTESATSREFLEAIGVDMEKLVYVQLDTIEDVFASVENIVEAAREKSKKVPIAIVVDSVMGASTKVEMESEWDKDGYATTKAIVMSKAMRKVTNLIAKENILLLCTNQVRSNVGQSFGDTESTSGGKALGFHASVRIKLKTDGKLKAKINGQDEVVGIKVTAEIKKNRVGPPFRKASFNIYFNSGIDDSGNWFEKLVMYGVIKKINQQKYSYTDSATGEVHEFSERSWRELMETNPSVRTSAYNELCTLSIMKYKGCDADSESVKVDDSPAGQEE